MAFFRKGTGREEGDDEVSREGGLGGDDESWARICRSRRNAQ
jgi:hypothetical protein